MKCDFCGAEIPEDRNYLIIEARLQYGVDVYGRMAGADFTRKEELYKCSSHWDGNSCEPRVADAD